MKLIDGGLEAVSHVRDLLVMEGKLYSVGLPKLTGLVLMHDSIIKLELIEFDVAFEWLSVLRLLFVSHDLLYLLEQL